MRLFHDYKKQLQSLPFCALEKKKNCNIYLSLTSQQRARNCFILKTSLRYGKLVKEYVLMSFFLLTREFVLFSFLPFTDLPPERATLHVVGGL